ncbi:MAG: SufD family Fe-S cluster assembly protein [Caldilineaceae bacterium]
MTVLTKESVGAAVRGTNGHHKQKPAVGFSEATVRALSAAREEPQWMLERRLAAWQTFEEMPWPKATDEDWRRTRLTGFNLDKFQPFAQPNDAAPLALESNIQHELDEMASAASLVFEDGGVRYRDMSEDLAGKGVIFADLQSAVLEHPELIQQYFMTEAVKPEHNKFTALHAALWDTGALIYVPKNTKVELPLQVILNHSKGTGGYHHTLLVAEEGAEVTVVDDLLGGEAGMQSAVVELIQKDNSVVRYMNLQDFDHSLWNFLTGRAILGRDTDLRWIGSVGAVA